MKPPAEQVIQLAVDRARQALHDGPQIPPKPRKLRLRADEPVEHDIQRQVCKGLATEIGPPAHLSKKGVVWWCMDHAHYAGIPALRAGRGIVAGVPDMYFNYRGRSHFIELKRPDGEISTVLSAPQQWTLPVLAGNGSRVGVARSLGEVLALLDEWGVPRNGLIKV